MHLVLKTFSVRKNRQQFQETQQNSSVSQLSTIRQIDDSLYYQRVF